MRQRKVFEVTVDPEEEPIPFTLRFTKPDGTTEDHDFDADANPGARGSLAVVAISRLNDRGKSVIDLNGLLAFFEKVMDAESYTRLRGLIDRRDLTIQLLKLVEVMNYIVEEQAARPTTPSSTSSNGQPTTGRLSMALPS